MQKTKLIDVANHAKVSKSTVSQYLNGRFEYMSVQTKKRIEQAIIALDYKPNQLARSLKTRKTKMIGVIVRDVAGYYSSQAIRGIDDFCKSNGYDVIIYNTDFDPKLEKRSLTALFDLHIDGIIMASSGFNLDTIKKYVEQGLPIVEFQIEHDNSMRDIVISDYRKASFEATEYLIQLGHKKICFVTQNLGSVKSRQDRYAGFCEALVHHNIDLDEQIILEWNRRNGFRTEPHLLLNKDNPPSVFFTQHLAITKELLAQCSHHNIEIPRDVSLIGFDDMPMANFLKVPITVIAQNAYAIGHESAKLLLNKLTGLCDSQKKITLPCSLEIRRSCRDVSQ